MTATATPPAPSYDRSTSDMKRLVYHALVHLSEGHALFAVDNPTAPGQVRPDVVNVISRMRLPIYYDKTGNCILVEPGRRKELIAWIHSQPL